MAAALRTALAVLAVACLAAGSRMTMQPRGGAMNHGLARSLGLDALPEGETNVTIGWHRQKLDHFNPQDERTFLQQYQVNASFHETDGPVFLLFGGEGPASPVWLSIDTAIMTYAQRFKAMAVQLEHRFYGKSQPFDDLSVENLRYLSSEQALADIADFIEAFRANNSLPEQTRFVVFGGSYSGALSAWFRTKYPHLAVASVATSAPVLAKLDYFEYHEVVSASLDTANSQCSARVANATAAIEAMLATGAGRAQLVKDFNVSDSSLNSTLDRMNFMETLAGNLDGVVQYNIDNRDFEGGPPPPNVTTVCTFVMDSTLSAYEAYIKLQSFLQGGSAMEVSYEAMIADMRNTSLAGDAAGGARQWVYQTCTEFAYFQTTDASDQPFGRNIPLSFSLQQCQDIYGIGGVNASVQWTNDNYGGKGIRGSRIIFPNGSIDPWHALSLTSATEEEAKQEIEVAYITGTAHCANMYPPSPKDLKELKEAREKIIDALKKWITEW